MEFAFDQRTEELSEQLWAFMHERVLHNEATVEEQLAAAPDPFRYEAPILDELKAEARAQGLWNLFLPDQEHGAGLTNLQ